MEADVRHSEVAAAVRFSFWSCEDVDQAAEQHPAASETFPCTPGFGEEPPPSAGPASCFGIWGSWHLLLCPWPLGLWPEVR